MNASYGTVLDSGETMWSGEAQASQFSLHSAKKEEEEKKILREKDVKGKARRDWSGPEWRSTIQKGKARQRRARRPVSPPRHTGALQAFSSPGPGGAARSPFFPAEMPGR